MRSNWTRIRLKGMEKYFIDFGRYEVAIEGTTEKWTASIDDLAHGEAATVKCGSFQTWDEAEKWVKAELYAISFMSCQMLEAINRKGDA